MVKGDMIITSPVSENYLIFTTSERLDAYRLSGLAKAGQLVKLVDLSTNKYKLYILETDASATGGLKYTEILRRDTYDNTKVKYMILGENDDLPQEGDEKTDYYKLENNNYIHYRWIDNDYEIISGNSYSKIESDNRYTKTSSGNVPTTSTVGNPGDIIKANDALYECFGTNGTYYIWKKISFGGGAAFTSEAALRDAIIAGDITAGMSISLLENGKYKNYIIQTVNTTTGTYTKTQSGGSYIIDDELPQNGDPDIDYYIGDSENGYIHYRYIASDEEFVIVGGDSYSKDEFDSKYVADVQIENNAVQLVNGKNQAMGNPKPLPPQGLQFVNISSTVINDKKSIILVDNNGVQLPGTNAVELPEGGTSIGQTVLTFYNNSGKSTNFTTASGRSTNLVVHYEELQSTISGYEQTTTAPNIKAQYKYSTESDSAYRTFFNITEGYQQGDITIPITAAMLQENKILNITVTARGATQIDQQGTDITPQKTLVFEVRSVPISLEIQTNAFKNWSTSIFPGNGYIDLQYTPHGAGIKKIMHIFVDDVELTTRSVDGQTVGGIDIGTTDGIALNYTINLPGYTYGAHSLRAYFITEDGVYSNIIENVIFVNTTSQENKYPLMGIKTPEAITEGETLSITYSVVQPGGDIVDGLVIRLLDSEDNELAVKEENDLSVRQIHTIGFSYNEYKEYGTYKVEFTLSGITKTVNAVVNQFVSPYSAKIKYITTGLLYDLDPTQYTNSSEGKEELSYTNNNYTIYTRNSNFNWLDNGNGFIQLNTLNENRRVLRLSGSARTEIQFKPFTTNFTDEKGNNIIIDNMENPSIFDNGRTIEIDYKVEASSDDSAVIISCANAPDSVIPDTTDESEDFVGIKVTPLTCGFKTDLLQSGDIKDGFITFEESASAAYVQKGQRIRLSFVLEKLNSHGENKQAVNIYINGIYGSSVPYNSSDTLAVPQYITIGSNKAVVDLYNVKIYGKELSATEVLQNYIASKDTLEQRENLAKRNDILANNDVSYNEAIKRYRVLKLKGYENQSNFISPIKSDEGVRYAGITLTFPADNNDGFTRVLDLNDENPNWTSEIGYTNKDIGRFCCYNKVQGTSSQQYIRKNLKIYLRRFANGIKKVKWPLKGYTTTNPDGVSEFVYDSSKEEIDCASIPESTLCFKIDYMSIDHANTFNANIANGLFTDKTPSQQIDERYQNTVYGFPCLLFFETLSANGETSTITFAGVGMLNNDKGNSKSFGLEDSNDEGNDTATQRWEFLNNTTDICKFKSDHLLVDDGNGDYLVKGALECSYPDQDDLKKENLSPKYDYIQYLFSWVCQRANYWTASTEAGTYTYNGVTYTTEKDYRKAIFKAEFTKHFNMNHALVYYCFLQFTGLVDNRAKNMFLRCENLKDRYKGNELLAAGVNVKDYLGNTITSITEHTPAILNNDGTVNINNIDWTNSTFGIWYIDLYDLDSAFGAENVGKLKIPYNADWDYIIPDDGQHGYNGWDSPLWLMFEDSFQAEIKEAYQILASKGLTFENFKRVHLTEGLNTLVEALVNRDMGYKYDDAWTKPYTEIVTNPDGTTKITEGKTTGDYKRLQTDRRFQKENWMRRRANLYDSKYAATAFKTDRIFFRPTAGEHTISITGLQDFYPAIIYGNSDSGSLVYPNNSSVPVLFRENNPSTMYFYTNASGNDDIYIFGASCLKTLNMSGCNPQTLNLEKAPNLSTFIYGNEAEQENSNLSLSALISQIQSLKLLETLNVGGLLSGNAEILDLSQNAAIKHIYAAGSSFSGVTLPAGARLETLHLPKAITFLKLIDQGTINDYSIEDDDYSNVKRLRIENTSGIPVLEILKNNLSRLTGVRLININVALGDDENDLLSTLLDSSLKTKRLKSDDTIDSNHNNYPEITGTITINKIGDTFKGELNRAYPNLNIVAGEVYNQYKVKFYVNNSLVDEQEVSKYTGNDYTATYGNNRTDLSAFPVKESTGSGTSAIHYLFDHWELSKDGGGNTSATANENTIENVHENVKAVAVFTSCTLPQLKEVDWTAADAGINNYLCYIPGTNNNTTSVTNDKILYTPEEFYAIMMSDPEDATIQQYYQIGKSRIAVDICKSDGTAAYDNIKQLDFDIAEILRYELADEPGKAANFLFVAHNTLTNHRMNPSNNVGGWDKSEMRSWLNTTVWGYLPFKLRVMISTVNVWASSGNGTLSTDDMVCSKDNLFLLSIVDVFGSQNRVVWNKELWSNIAPVKACTYFINKKIKYARGVVETGNGNWWWLRTPDINTSYFRLVIDDGNSHSSNAYNSNGVAFGLCIGRKTSNT